MAHMSRQDLCLCFRSPREDSKALEPNLEKIMAESSVRDAQRRKTEHFTKPRLNVRSCNWSSSSLVHSEKPNLIPQRGPHLWVNWALEPPHKK